MSYISQRLYTTYRHCNMKSYREFVTFLDHRQKSKKHQASYTAILTQLTGLPVPGTYDILALLMH